MSDYIKKLFTMLVAAILAHANRLARLAAIRHEMEAFASAYEEANNLEASGKPEIARFMRSQIGETLGSAMAADNLPAVNGDGEPPPFVGLPRPTPAGLNPPEGGGTAPRRRGRRPSGANGAKSPREETSQGEPSGQSDTPEPPPTTPSTDQHP